MEKFEYLNELQVVVEKLIHSYGFLVMFMSFLQWVAFFAAVLVMILDGTKWKSTNMLTSLLAPYLFVGLPLVIFQFLRTEFVKWIALLTVVLKLFLPKQFPESLEVPGATLLLIVAAPNFFMESFRDDLRMRDPASVCLYTSFYLLDRHTKACGGYKNSFTQKDKITCTICLYLLSAYPFCSIFSTFSYFFYEPNSTQ